MAETCTKCGVKAPLAPSNISRKTGLRLYRTWCVVCEKKRKQAWVQEHKEHVIQKNLIWARNNPEKRKQHCYTWLQKNPAHNNTYRKQHRQNNPELYRALVNERRKRVKQATPKWLDEFERLWVSEVYHLAQLRKQTVDHIIPIQGKTVCGLHVPWNLQILPAKENYAKSNKF